MSTFPDRSPFLRRLMAEPLAAIALFQGIYYTLTGIWPLLSMRSFQWVTGPKRDDWLVRTVGILVSVIGAVLALAGTRRRVDAGTVTLATGSALGLTAIDVWYVRRGRIRRIYLLDALAEIGLVAGWVAARILSRQA